MKTLEDIFVIETGNLKSRIKEDQYAKKTLIYSKNYFDMDFNFEKIDSYFEEEFIMLNKDKYSVTSKNDIIVDSLSKKAAIVSTETANMYYSFNYFKLIPKTNNINLNFFLAWFNLSDDLRLQLDLILQGTYIKKLTLRQLKSLKINLPSLDIQLKIGNLYKKSKHKFNIAKQINANEEDLLIKILGDYNE